MPVYKIHQAKTHLSWLIAQVASGAEIIITRNGDPVARMVPLSRSAVRRFGAMAGRIALPDAFFDPLPEDELTARGE